MYIGKSPADVLIGPTVSSVDISDGTIETIDIANGAITNAKVATGIDSIKLADGSVTNAELQYINSLSSNAQTQIGTKSPIASPTFTGTPAVPTASAATNTTQVASTAYVRTEVSNLVASAPSALDTLNELAAALGDDASFSTTVTNSIATKLPLAGGAMTGAITTNSTFDGVDIATRDAILSSTTTTANAALPKAGGTMTGDLTIDKTTPLLLMKADADATTEINFYDGSTRIADISASGTNNELVIDARSGHALELRGGGTANSLYINTSGNVGIGTVAPHSTLHAEGTPVTTGGGKVAGILTLDNPAGSSDGNKAGIVFNTNSGGTANAFITAEQDGSAHGTLYFGGYDGTSTRATVLTLDAGSGTATFGNHVASTTLTTGAIVCTTINTGNGVCEIHQMNQGVTTNDSVTFTGITGTTLALSSATTPNITLTDTTNTCVSVLKSGNTEAIVGTTSNHGFRIDTNDTPAITLDTSQRATFADNIYVKGDELDINPTGTAYLRLSSRVADGSEGWYFKSSGDASNTYLELGSRWGSDTARVNFTATGTTFAGTVQATKLGVGTAPSRILEVESGDQFYGDFNTTADNGAYFSFQIDGADVGYLGSRYHLQAATSGYEDDIGLRAQGHLVLQTGTSKTIVFNTNNNNTALTLNADQSATFAGTVTVNNSSHSSLAINSPSDATAAWTYYKQNGTLRWATGREGSSTNYQIANASWGVMMNMEQDGDVTFAGDVTIDANSDRSTLKIIGTDQYTNAGVHLNGTYSGVTSNWFLTAVGGTSGWGSANGSFVIRDDNTNSTGLEVIAGSGSNTATLTLNADDSATFAGTIRSGHIGIGEAPSADIPISVTTSTTSYAAKFHNTHATDGHGLYIRSSDDGATNALQVDNQAGNATLFLVRGDGSAYTNGNLSVGSHEQYQGFTVHGRHIYMSPGYDITWANGNAVIGENNYSLEFDTYTGSALTRALTLAGDNTATFTGAGNFAGSLTAGADLHITGNVVCGANMVIGSHYLTDCVRSIQMGHGGQVMFGDIGTTNPLGISEGLWDTFTDTDNLTIYCRQKLDIRGYTADSSVGTELYATFDQGVVTFAGNVTAQAITANSDITVFGDSDIIPSVDNEGNLGNASYRWSNLYVADMQLSNENTGGNDVDGTEGSWTIQEGEDDLFLLNRKNGKKYKFKLEVV